ncbi:hypothetical protein L9F63_014642 [Diploptera punctata]|uniref:Ionotropic glutamate receptor C-terminal domain-containing protein n=1 Tax=Diploptera punctata TaxID=6984 RepID=A0AAD8A7R8_DIPPU|nr:hypothetical protein L9F63_014642 [Diploptera punctata]
MRTQLYAFHGDSDALRVVSRTYQEYEKCRLSQIKMFISVQLSFAVRKGSPYGEHVRRTFLANISAFIDNNRASSIVAYSCHNNDIHAFSKIVFDKGLTFSLVCPACKIPIARLLNTEYNHIAVIVDMSCKQSIQFMAEASKGKKFSILHHWLLLTDAMGEQGVLDLNEDPLIASLENLDIPLDSHVTVARLKQDLESVILQDVYRLGDQPFLTVTTPFEWKPGQRWRPEPLRTNYRGAYIKTAVIVVEDPWEHFFDMRYKHLNTLSKNNYALMAYVSEMLNFRMNLTMADSWGFPVNGTSTFAGIVGIMQRGEVEIGAAGLLIKETRMDYIDYAGEIVTFRGAFMFLKPSLSEVSIIYTLPFSGTVWFTFTLTVIILTIGLEFSHHFVRKINPSDSNPPNEWSEAILNSVGIVCEQGASNPPENVSSRIIFLALLMLSVFVLTSYSAIIVSLLQTSSDAINTLTQLMDSGFKLSMRDIGFNTNYANDTIDPEIKRLYRDKLFSQPYKEAFTTQEVGVQKNPVWSFRFPRRCRSLQSDERHV